jgi:hypothetical protein
MQRMPRHGFARRSMILFYCRRSGSSRPGLRRCPFLDVSDRTRLARVGNAIDELRSTHAHDREGGCLWWIQRLAATPYITCMSMSIRMTSGRIVRASSTPSLPLLAQPITSKRGSVSRKETSAPMKFRVVVRQQQSVGDPLIVR